MAPACGDGAGAVEPAPRQGGHEQLRTAGAAGARGLLQPLGQLLVRVAPGQCLRPVAARADLLPGFHVQHAARVAALDRRPRARPAVVGSAAHRDHASKPWHPLSLAHLPLPAMAGAS
jgi:hypothetical protein